MPDKYAIGSLNANLRDGKVSDAYGVVTQLRPKTAQVLRLLLDRRGNLVSREELIGAIWPDTHVTENGLSQCIAEIRRALGPSQTLLRTLPRRGYVLDGALNTTESCATAVTARSSVEARGNMVRGIPAVAVLPFHYHHTEPSFARIADVLMDALVGALATSREPIVISANSTRVAFGGAADLKELSRRLGASYLVGGSLHSQGEHVSLFLELSKAESGTVVWHRSFDFTEQALLQELDQIAAFIAHALIPKLRQAELRRARTLRAHKLSAYHLMLEAQVLIARLDPDVFDEARRKLIGAAKLDPGFAPARQAMANWYSLRIGQQWSTDREEDTRALISEAKLAIEMDGSNGRALALLGHSQAIIQRDYDSAQELIDRAISECPNDAEARMWATPTLAYVGRLDEAVINAEYAVRLSPEDPLMYRYEHFLSIAHYCNKNYTEAARFGLSSMHKNENYTSNLILTTAALAALDRLPEARSVVQKILKLQPKRCVSDVMAATAFIDPATRLRYAQQLRDAGLP